MNVLSKERILALRDECKTKFSRTGGPWLDVEKFAHAVAEAAIAAYHERRGMSGWHPIETAPKDGAEFLAYGKAGTFITAWRPDQCKGFGVIDSCCGYYEDCEPTHWRPLPPPPASITGDQP